MTDGNELTGLFKPQSIAVVGASADAGKIGGIPFSYQLKFGFTGRLYAVNPGAEMVQGCKSYKSLIELPEVPDLAIVAVPAKFVPEAIGDMAKKGIRNAVIFSSGFAEVGASGRAEQQKIIAEARAAGIRLLGPNCLGFMNIGANIYATFTPAPNVARASKGHIAIVSQSGAFGAYAYSLARMKGLGLSYWITTGNEADVGVADCISFCVDDPDTKVILAYMEGCSDGLKLKRAFRAAHEAGKPVVVVKIGRTEQGAEAAASHTAALAGDDAAFDTLFRQYGVWRAHSIEEFFHVGYALSVGHLPTNPRVGIMTVSGGVGALMADDASLAGIELTPMPKQAQNLLLERVPFAAPRNPVDITGQATSDPGLIEFATDLMLSDGGYGTLISFFAAAGTAPRTSAKIIEVTGRMRERHPDALLIVSTLFSPETRQQLEALGCLCFEEPHDAIRVVAAIAFLAEKRKLPAFDLPGSGLTASAENQAIDEATSLKLVAAHGIPVVPYMVVRAEGELPQASQSLGFPLAVKVLSAAIPHKSDIGGVALNIATDEALLHAYRDVCAKGAKVAPADTILGAIVAPMVKGGVECIMGARRDPVLGPIILFGLGGVAAESLKDVVIRIAPIDKPAALGMVKSIRAASLLDAFRGRPARDIDAIAAGLVALSELISAPETVSAIDINPVMVMEQGKGIVALDALAMMAPKRSP